MKKALIITAVSGFVPQFEMNQVFLLQKLGYEVHYATNFDHPVYDYDRELFRKNGIVTHPLSIEKSPARIRRNFQAFLQLKRLLEGERFDLIHCHNPMGGVLGRLAGSLYSSGAVILYTAHGFHFYKGAPIKNWLLYYPAESVLARLTDFLITINEEDYLRGKRFHLRPNGSVWKIPGAGLDVRRFVPKPDARAEEKAALGFPSDSFLLLSAGELNRNKNHETVIRALSLLPEKNVFYGICGRGDGRGRLEELIGQEGLTERVRLLGYRKDIEDVLPAADCFLFPSKREGFGMAAVEAMAAGLPLITSDCRGTREYMRDGITGIVCKRNRPEDYAEAVRSLRNDPGKREHMGQASRERSLLFSTDATLAVMKQVYEAALHNREYAAGRKKASFRGQRRASKNIRA